MTIIADPWTWISVIIGIGNAFCLFPLYYRVLKTISWLQRYIDGGRSVILLRCCQFLVTPLFILKPTIYSKLYIYAFGGVAIAKSFKFRRKMIALGLDPKTEQRRRREISK
jgi:hypothetical protein